MMSLFRDVRGNQVQYEAVSIIEYVGSLSRTGQSHGHYICDVKEKKSKIWFRTNDDQYPIQLPLSEVSQNGYVVLYKRI